MIAIRVLRDGAVVREAVFREPPVSLGRDPAADFPLPDASVSRRHALLEADGEGRLTLRDLESRNGLHVGPARVASAPVSGLLRCRLGTQELEIVALADEPTLELRVRDWRRFERRRTTGDHIRYVLLGLLGWLAVVLLDPEFWSPWSKNRAGTLMGHAIAALVAQPILAFLLLVALKAAGRSVRVADTLQALARAIWYWPAVMCLGLLTYYPLSSAADGAVTGLLWAAALAASVVTLASVRRAPPSRLFRAVWAATVVAVLAGSAWTGVIAQRRQGAPDLDFVVQRPLAGWVGRSQPFEGYLGRVRDSAAEAAAAAAEVRARQER